MMFKKFALLVSLVFSISFSANASIITWELVDFEFDDGGTANGSFTFDFVNDELFDIDINTTGGSILGGRQYIGRAGSFGNLTAIGVFAFSDVLGPDFLNAGFFRFDANIGFDAVIGTIVGIFVPTGSESFCTNSACSSAANEITNPDASRELISGSLRAVSSVANPDPQDPTPTGPGAQLPVAVSEPTPVLLMLLGMFSLMMRRKASSLI